jgi:hypothetical protein
VILAEDEAWMYLQATTMYVWSPCGQTPVVRVDPGRKKAGFYGTLNLHTGEEIVTRSEVFNAQVSAQHLQQVLDAFPDRPILSSGTAPPGTMVDRSANCWRPTRVWRLSSSRSPPQS